MFIVCVVVVILYLQNGLVDFEEFVCGVTLLLHGSFEEKCQFLFEFVCGVTLLLHVFSFCLTFSILLEMRV